MWEVRNQAISSGMRTEIFLGDTQLSFSEFFSLLESSADFARWYSETIASCEFEAFFWELPPLTADTLGNGAEFVVIESASLSRLRPDPRPFESQFALQQGSDVITFPNLGGDALLFVPAQIGSMDSYPHLATFLRSAPRSQVRLLWQVAAKAVRDNLSHTSRWLSTAGLGVSWLHLRLDTRPKYYSFSPYKTAA
jgi:hypothetical protein